MRTRVLVIKIPRLCDAVSFLVAYKSMDRRKPVLFLCPQEVRTLLYIAVTADEYT